MKKLCILGTAQTLKEAPINEDYEFWALNDMYDVVPVDKISRWFEIHRWEFIKEHISKRTNSPYAERLAQLKMPIYMQEQHSEIPTSVKYPLETLIEHFGRRFFNSTIDYMLALAIYEGYQDISIYGVHMSYMEEYGEQRPSCLYWLGVAEGKGIKIHIPDDSDLLKSYWLYGYEDKKRKDLEIKGNARLKELERQSAEFQKNYYLSLGAMDTWKFILKEL